jgi:hypothetical protein
VRRTVALLLGLLVVLGLGGTTLAGAANVDAEHLTETQLSQQVTADAVPLAVEILRDYHEARPHFRRERILGGSPVFGTVNRTELTIDYYAHSTLTGKQAEYIVTAEFRHVSKHPPDPADVIGVAIHEPVHTIERPLYDVRVPSTFGIAFTTVEHPTLDERRYPPYWEIDAEYFTGRAFQIDEIYDARDDHVDWGAGISAEVTAGICRREQMSPSLLGALDTQAREVLQQAETHAPITIPENLSAISQNANCPKR